MKGTNPKAANDGGNTTIQWLLLIVITRLYSVQWTAYSVHCTLYNVHCTVVPKERRIKDEFEMHTELQTKDDT